MSETTNVENEPEVTETTEATEAVETATNEDAAPAEEAAAASEEAPAEDAPHAEAASAEEGAAAEDAAAAEEATAAEEPKAAAAPESTDDEEDEIEVEPTTYRVSTRDEEIVIDGRIESVTKAKEISIESGVSVLVERTDGRVKMNFRDGSLVDYVLETRKGRRA